MIGLGFFDASSHVTEGDSEDGRVHHEEEAYPDWDRDLGELE